MTRFQRRSSGLGSRRAKITLAVAVVAFCALTGTVLADEGWLGGHDNPWPYQENHGRAVLAAVGDISCQPAAPANENESPKDLCSQGATPPNPSRWQAQTATANQIENDVKPNLVAVLGDEQYQVGRYEDFMGSFDHTYGAFKFLQRPAPGNHEFYDRNKSGKGETGVKGYGYFDYYNGYQVDPSTGNPLTTTFTINPLFGSGTFTQPSPRADGQAGHFDTANGVGDGWYSYDLRGWHIISLNIECQVQPGGCNQTGSWFSSETSWLAQDLATDHASCTMAYWHQPLYSANASPSSNYPAPGGADPEGPMTATWWRLLYQHGADVVLNGHDHLYARYAPQDAFGNADPRRGIREFIVGTGGESLDTLNSSATNLQKGTDQYYGVMKMTLQPGRYAWDFQSAPNAPSPGAGTYSDTGSASCHGGEDHGGE